MSDRETAADDTNGPTRGRSTTNGTGEDRIEAIATENRTLLKRVSEVEEANRTLRDQLDELERALADVTSCLARSAVAAHDGNDGQETGAGTDAKLPLLPSGGQVRKIVGEIDDDAAGVGVFGHNTAGSGTTYGVWGEVDSPDGFGLYTPDDARVDGDIEIGTGTLSFSDSTVQRTAGPVAKGWVSEGGFISNAVNVDDVTWDSDGGRYRITLTGESYMYNEYATYVTSVYAGEADVSWSVTSNAGDLIATPSDGNQHHFQFVTHKLI